ncbi:MAG: hypothetical protein HY394_05385 [Candidatus Diapherotrites archaeon]|nr:hypothetical protein [Candidatus Diapherotrites archaeon]
MAVEVSMDLHNHLVEKNLDPARWWASAKAKRLDVIAITEHAHLDAEKSYRKLRELQPKGIVLVPGMELNTDFGHVLCLATDAETIFSLKELRRWELPMESALKIAEEHGFLLVIAHPWGFDSDSAAFMAGEKKLKALVRSGKVGVEAYNGLVAHMSEFVYGTAWFRKPINFLDFLGRNRFAKKIRINRVTGALQKRLESKSREMVERCVKAMALAQQASFITAGSDAHHQDRIGSGIIRFRLGRRPANAKDVLDCVKNRKGIAWIGPQTKKIGKGRYEKFLQPITRKEVVQGLGYATKKAITSNRVADRIRKRMPKMALRERLAKARKRIPALHLREKISGARRKAPKMGLRERISSIGRKLKRL